MSIDFAAARQKMVDNQLRTTDVTSHAVLMAFLAVAREDFVPSRLRPLAYIDSDLEIVSASAGRSARFLMEASPMAKLIQLGDVSKSDVVLEVGCGTGYASAILSLIAESVVALESDTDLAAQASETLSEGGYDNVAVVTGDLARGYPDEGPYDFIFINGAVEEVPAVLLDQLRDGGRLVAVVGHGAAARGELIVREGDNFSGRTAFNAAVMALPGFEKAAEFIF